MTVKKNIAPAPLSPASPSLQSDSTLDMNLFMRAAVDGAGASIMMCDRDLNITYVNRSTQEMIQRNLAVFRQVFPRVDMSNLVGTSIDVFHKNPAHQRQLLNDPANMPYRTDIQVGPLTFRLNVTAILDVAGNYLGNTLEWSDVTEVIQQENQAARLFSSIEGASTAIMTIDRELRITYINPASLNLFKKYLSTFREVYRGFDVDRLLGTCVDIFHKNPAHQRRLLERPENLPHKADIRVGSLVFSLNVTAMQDAQGHYIGNTLEWSDVTEIRAKETEIARLSGMIQEAETRFMVCDRDLRITYCNPSVLNLMRRYEAQLRTVFPRFEAHRLIGVCIDDFHQNPALQRRLLSDVKNLPYKAEIKVAGLEFGVNATAILDAEGNHIGNAVEWTDYNERALYSKEVARLYQAILRGELRERGNLESLAAAYRPMLQNINEIIEAIVEPIDEIREKLALLAQGDMQAYVTGTYQGDHNILKDGLNNTLDSLNELAHAADAISNGDLTVEVEPKSEKDAMGLSMLAIVKNLNRLLGEIQTAAGQIATGSDQIAHSSQNLAQGATQQASSLEEINASMTEIAAQTQQNADNATQANILANAAQQGASNGDAQMQEMIKAMQQIQESSQNISKIIKVIDEIAFQTNLLALNAAVEAARAGVHGKGFAVVADEVRNLAARSAKAAKETTTMIEDSTKRVFKGMEIAERTAKALVEIVSGVTKASDLVGEIAAASKEQAAGIQQINLGLTQLEQVTQQNTAVSEESAAAAHELAEQATNLQEQLSQFKLKELTFEVPGMPIGITPELLALIQQYLATQQKPPVPKTIPGKPQSFSSARALPSASSKALPATQNAAKPSMPANHSRTTPAKSGGTAKGKRLDPKQIIDLDDPEFGRY